MKRFHLRFTIFSFFCSLFSFFSSYSVTAEARWRLAIFRHTQIQSLSLFLPLGGYWVCFLYSLLVTSFCVFLHYSPLHWQQMLKGEVFKHPNIHFLIVLCSDWVPSLGQGEHAELFYYCTLTYIHSCHMYVHITQTAVSILLETLKTLAHVRLSNWLLKCFLNDLFLLDLCKTKRCHMIQINLYS